MFNFLTGLGWQTKIIAIGILAIACFAGGWQVRGWKADAGLAHSIAKTEKTRQNDIGQADKIVKTAETVKEEIRYVEKTIIKKIPALPDADHVCFTHESLGLWNQSIAAADSHRPKPADAAKAADSVDNREIVANVQQVLENATENFAICKENAVNQNALIDRIESLQGKMCYCAE